MSERPVRSAIPAAVRLTVMILALSTALMSVGCGGGEPVEELRFVPGTVLAHFHADHELPGYVIQALPRIGRMDWTALSSLVEENGFGVSLLGVDISDLSPQLLLLTRAATPERMAEALASSSGSETRDAGSGRIDLIDRGSPWASVAARDGWTAVYIGGAPEVVLEAWMRMDAGQSLAADTSLTRLIPRDPCSYTLLVSSSMLGFLSVAPVERWVPWWGRVEPILDRLRPEALLAGIELDPFVRVELRLARPGGKITRLMVEAEDEDLQAALPGLLQLLSLGRLL